MTLSVKINFRKYDVKGYIALLQGMGSIGQVMAYILANMGQKTNEVNVTQQTIHNETGLSLGTVNASLQYLMDMNWLIGHNGRYMVNPYMDCVGDSKQIDFLGTRFRDLQTIRKDSRHVKNRKSKTDIKRTPIK